MKKLLLFLATVGGLIGVTWLGRDRLLPPPDVTTDPTPRFRSSTPVATNGASPPTPDDTTSAEARDRAGDDLEDITGIGPVFAGRLAAAGITGIADLAHADPDDVSEKISVTPTTVADWIGQARMRSR